MVGMLSKVGKQRSEPEPADLAARLVRKIDQLPQGEPPLEAVLEIEAAFMDLRAMSEARPGALDAHVAALRDARTRFETRKGPLALRLVDELHKVRAQMRATEHREACLREAVVWLSRSSGREIFCGVAAEATVRSDVRRQLPRPGTPDRDRLEAAVRAAGLWERASILSSPRLDQAFRDARLSSSVRSEIDRLSPRRAVSSVRVTERTRR